MAVSADHLLHSFVWLELICAISQTCAITLIDLNPRNELYNWGKKFRKKFFFLKIDFEKAYDNVNWSFLLSILHQMDFPSRWCGWIRGVIESARSSVLVNGSPTFEFKCSKGIRQGDPISPFLFIIVMEALSHLIGRAKSAGDVVGIKTPMNGPVISHLFYADDAIILGEWSKDNIENVVRILRIFHLCSGLKINLAKSNLFGVGIDTGELDSMAEIIGCQAKSFPFRYLGLTVGANMNRPANWKPVYDIVEARLAKWKAAMLSMGGRVTLIKSVLESLPTYFFSLYKAPVQVIKDIEAKIRNFLWGGDQNNRKIHWAAWDRVACPTDKGGLGLSRLKNINISLLAKWGWRFKVDKEKLWVKVIEAVHSTKNRMDSFPVRKTIGGVWCNIINLLDKVLLENKPLKQYIVGKVGSGEVIQFWLDPWLSIGPLFLRFPALFQLENKKDCKIADRFGLVEGFSRFRWQWKRHLSVGQEIDELIELSSLLINIDLNDNSDKWDWMGSVDGQFSVGLVKSLLSKNLGLQGQYIPSRCKWIPRKCNIFIWRLGLDKLATMDALRKRNIELGNQSCVLCGEEDESVSHLFTSCYLASSLWSIVSSWCKIPPIMAFSVKDLLETHENIGLKGRKKEVIQGIIRIGCWCIWKARNDARFNYISVNLAGIITELKSVGLFWLNSRSKNYNVSWREWCSFVNM
ncbi:putative RNA-directed DNA polymerase [Helianthus annuus]|uniref:RNA-directed DNA polymerase n=1 Tax=Helianthus annuus TaxID=4232 RepID=A0A9K3JCD1_HELAN|nr:putative RNA-directed DNA polymerase [Helianthus annuus]